MTLFIGNLSYETTEEELREALSDFEPIINIRRPLDRETGEPRGFAFVTFETREVGEKAMAALNGKTLGDRELKVNEAEERRPSRHPGQRPERVSMKVDVKRRVDDRPIGPDGKRVRYKGI